MWINAIIKLSLSLLIIIVLFNYYNHLTCLKSVHKEKMGENR